MLINESLALLMAQVGGQDALSAYLSERKGAIDSAMAERVADTERIAERMAADAALAKTEPTMGKGDRNGLGTGGAMVMRRAAQPLTDRRSAVVPFLPSVGGAATAERPETVRRGFTLPIGPMSASAAAWDAIGVIRQYGFRFVNAETDAVAAVPFAAILAKRAQDAAIRVGRAWQTDRADDVAQDALERAHAVMVAFLARIGAAECLPFGPLMPGQSRVEIVWADAATHAAMGAVAGAYVSRTVRCMVCGACEGKSSKYGPLGECVGVEITEYVDAQRIVSRALYAAAADSVKTRIHVDADSDSGAAILGILQDVATIGDRSIGCAHEGACGEPCRAAQVVTAVAEIVTAAGGTLTATGGIGSDAARILCAVFGNAYSDNGVRKVTAKLRTALTQRA